MTPLLPALALLLALASDGLTAFQGRVLDSTGTAVPDAVLEVRHPGQEPVLARATTNLDGEFLIRLADDSEPVVITITCDGFASMTLGPTHLSSSTRMDLTLHRRSELEETVEVEGTGATVPLDGNPAATSFSEMAVEALPLVGRTITDVLVLAPGITETDSGRIHVRGARDTGLQLRLDGSNVTNPLTGQFGQEVNLETVQEVQVVTSGAPAEYGRADGGFAEVITKSGGNDVSGSLKLYYRSSFIDGDGANGDRERTPSFDDTSLYGTLGGPLVRDHLWYFGSVQRIRRETPVTLADGPFIVTSARGTSSFLKTTWQADTLNKLSVQVNADPLETLGNHIGPTIAAESDYRLETGGPLYHVNWTSVLSPDLLMTALISALDTGRDIEPVSSDFSPREIERLPLGNQFAVPLPCLTRNCQGDRDLHRFFREDTFGTRASRGPLREAGPYNIRSDQTLRRITLRSDVSYVKEGSSGQHSFKSGFEANDEEYLEEAVHNPTLTDRSCEFLDCNIGAFPAPPPGTRYGRLLLEVHDPAERLMRADGLNLGFYVQDAWRIRPNLLLHVGVRADLEEVDTIGRSQFDTLAESRESLRRFDLVCEAFGNNCTNARTPGRRDGPLPAFFTPAPGDPALEFDRNRDGTLQFDEIALINEPFTNESDLVPEPFHVSNTNIAPRISVSWDPGADGGTRLSASFGRYYDRLFLGAVALEQEPVSFVADWTLFGQTNQAEPGELSRPLSGAVSMSQTDRELQTPYTDELSLSVERELAPEWSASLLYLDRKGRDLLQDVDRNHITCPGFRAAYGVDPSDVCGDGGGLELDRFGFVEADFFDAVTFHPNGAIDLYHLNPRFNQILRVENANSSRYKAIEVRLRRRLRHNWQMEGSYTYSTARGESESFVGLEGNDPAVSDKIPGYLDYDQRHIFKFQAASHLKHGVVLGATLLWESGLPYSIVANVEDHDDVSNITPQRIITVTGKQNDQRNASRLTINGHIEKRLSAGSFELTGFLDIENMLDSDDLRLREVDIIGLDAIDGERRFGRRFQAGVGIIF